MAARDGAPVPASGPTPLGRRPRLVFLGSKALGVAVLECLLETAPDVLAAAVTFDDRADVRTAFDALATVCARAALPLHVATDRRDAERLLRTLAPDLCVVSGWYWLLGAETLEAAPLGYMGLHFSRLPAYRGTSPLVWQILNGEREAGFSLFRLTEAMDEGPVWAQGTVPIGPDDDVAVVLARLERASIAAIAAVVPDVLAGRATPRPQDAIAPTYCAARLPDDGRLDFGWTARACHDFVRAQTRPYPGAFTTLGDERLTVWRTRLVDVTYYGRPGQVVQVAPDGVTVVCGDHRPLRLETVHWRGEDRRAAEVLRSVRLRLPSPIAP